jgi:demethylmenaquinone methyltransferase/2-methoxy-6-polyprenyl-1,4-benzoquinol methylase
MVFRNGDERKRSIRHMFARLAPRYDLINRIITLGQDRRWRKETIKHLELNGHSRALDAGTGTGELAFQILRSSPKTKVIAVDFTPQMIRCGQKRDQNANIAWVIADVNQLPFADDSFNAVVSGFVLRNVGDIERMLEEQNRILKPRGRIACLETSPPTKGIISLLLSAYMRYIMPILGSVISGDKKAYHYLERSTHDFLSTDTLAQRFRDANFDAIQFAHYMFGNVAIHWARKDHQGS